MFPRPMDLKSIAFCRSFASGLPKNKKTISAMSARKPTSLQVQLTGKPVQQLTIADKVEKAKRGRPPSKKKKRQTPKKIPKGGHFSVKLQGYAVRVIEEDPDQSVRDLAARLNCSDPIRADALPAFSPCEARARAVVFGIMQPTEET